jgi:hypothetical protein
MFLGPFVALQQMPSSHRRQLDLDLLLFQYKYLSQANIQYYCHTLTNSYTPLDRRFCRHILLPSEAEHTFTDWHLLITFKNIHTSILGEVNHWVNFEESIIVLFYGGCSVILVKCRNDWKVGSDLCWTFPKIQKFGLSSICLESMILRWVSAIVSFPFMQQQELLLHVLLLLSTSNIMIQASTAECCQGTTQACISLATRLYISTGKLLRNIQMATIQSVISYFVFQ